MRCLARMFAMAAAVFMAMPDGAQAGSAQLSVTVPAGKTRSVRLRRLPKGAEVAVAVSASAPLGVALVSGSQLKSDRPTALFRGQLDRRMSFKVQIPADDDYYVVLDNRAGREPVRATATIQAVRGTGTPEKKSRPMEQTRLLAPAGKREHVA